LAKAPETAAVNPIDGVDDDTSVSHVQDFVARRTPRESFQRLWIIMIVCLFPLTTMSTLGLVAWAFYIDAKIALDGISPPQMESRVITGQTVQTLINATVIEIGSAVAALTAWGFLIRRR